MTVPPPPHSGSNTPVLVAGVAACARPRQDGRYPLCGAFSRAARWRVADRRAHRPAGPAGRRGRDAVASPRAQHTGQTGSCDGSAAARAERPRSRVHRSLPGTVAADSRRKDGRRIVVRRADPACQKLRCAPVLDAICPDVFTATATSGRAVFGDAFFMVRPLAAAQDASPAVLRLALRPERDGLTVDIAKRRGPARTESLSIPLQPTPVLFSHHARISRRPLAPVAARGLPATVAA